MIDLPLIAIDFSRVFVLSISEVTVDSEVHFGESLSKSSSEVALSLQRLDSDAPAETIASKEKAFQLVR